MKKILLASTMVLLSTGAFAKAHGPAGCGLGEVLFAGQTGVGFNVLAATFNATSGNQTFGMTTGTLGCEDAVTAKVGAASFVEANKFALANDIARGSGDTLNAYLTIIGSDNADKKTLQKNYTKIFAEGKSANEIHQSMMTIIKG